MNACVCVCKTSGRCRSISCNNGDGGDGDGCGGVSGNDYGGIPLGFRADQYLLRKVSRDLQCYSCSCTHTHTHTILFVRVLTGVCGAG